MDQMNITAAQYVNTNNDNIRATIDGVQVFVPTDPNNRHYAEIMRQVEAGELTIQEAE